MHKIGLSAFLKIFSKGSPQKHNDYSKYLTPGGFDFYYPLKQSAFQATVIGQPLASVLGSLEEISGEVQRKYNVLAMKALASYMKKWHPTDYFAAPSTAVSTPLRYLSVKLEPEFGAVIKGERRLIHLWYAKDASLSKPSITIGNRLIQKHLCVGEFSDCKASILDLRKKELLTVVGDDLVTDLLISGEFAWIDNFFKAHEKPAGLAETA